jgi:aspartyl/asparaginyl-tRNA synthetase
MIRLHKQTYFNALKRIYPIGAVFRCGEDIEKAECAVIHDSKSFVQK